MKRLALLILAIFPWLSTKADTNLPPATTLLLDEKAAVGLTAELRQYENPPNVAGKFTTLGSPVATILFDRWASEFMTLYPQVTLDIRAGGSQAGLSGLLDGKVDLVPAIDPLTPDELARFKAKFGYAPSQIVVAHDALGIYVNKDNPISGLTMAQLDAIYSREPKRGGGPPEFWSDLGISGTLGGQRISRISLNQAHSVHAFFRSYVMKDENYRLDVHFELVPGSLVQAVGADDAAIGVASIMFATKRTRFVPLQTPDGRYRLPTYEETVSGHYPLTHSMRIVFNLKPNGEMNPVAREFLRFAVSRRGQRIIALAASFPITSEEQNEALRVIDGRP